MKTKKQSVNQYSDPYRFVYIPAEYMGISKTYNSPYSSLDDYNPDEMPNTLRRHVVNEW